MCHIVFKLHVFDLTVISGGGGNGGAITGMKAAEPVTTVEHCVSTFVSMASLENFKVTLGQFHAAFVATKHLIYVMKS